MLYQSPRNGQTWVCVIGGVCRAKLGAQCILRCPIEKRKRRKAIAAANAAAVAAAARAVSRPADGVLTSQVSMRESVSSTSDSLDDDIDISQEPTGMQCHRHDVLWHCVMLHAAVPGKPVGQGHHACVMQQAVHCAALSMT